jgi:CDP-diacylglycerol pyrophosphatase
LSILRPFSSLISPCRHPSAAAARVWVVVLVVAAILGGCAPHAGGSRDILWRIVSQCLDASVPGYCTTCASPIEGTCGDARGCTATIDVWAKAADYVAIRDIKMCGCPTGFVHGLALPRVRVTGIEDARRPAGIWPFAWQTAQSRIADEQQIALVVNPPGLERTQDQLHVHLLRLIPGARARLAASSPARTPDIDRVWNVAARDATVKGLAAYGVLVMRDAASNDFLVTTQRESPEDQFTVSTCR